MNNILRRDHAVAFFRAGVDAADPFRAVKQCIRVAGNELAITGPAGKSGSKRAGAWPAVQLVAFGKAACAMIKAAQECIPASRLKSTGIAVTNYENQVEIGGVTVLGAGHPLPDKAGQNAAKKIAECVQNAKAGELVLVLVSGGGSALLPYPVAGISLEEKIRVTELLLSSGADIRQINCVRKHLSGLKGGGLARLIAPADCHALILSDVLDNDLSVIASGPTIPDDSTFADAIAVLKSRGIWDRAPLSVKLYLQKGSVGVFPETAKSGDPIFKNCGNTIIGSNAISVDAAMRCAEGKGYQPVLYSKQLCGEARAEAEKIAVYVKGLQDQGISKPVTVIAGGETTVTIKGRGKGGRNQEMALAFALAAEQAGLGDYWVFLSGGTDGRDGLTDAAGGIVDPGSLKRMREGKVDPAAALADNDSHSALKASGDLLVTGPTGTNVADLQIVLLYPA